MRMPSRRPRPSDKNAADGAKRWLIRDAIRRPETVAAASTVGFVSMVVATAVDSVTGRGVAVVADVTLAVAAGVLGGMWVELPRGQSAELAQSIRQLLVLSAVSLIVFGGVYLLAQRSLVGQRFERDVLLGRGAGSRGLQGGATAILDQITAGAVGMVTLAACCIAAVRRRLGLAFATALAVMLTLLSAALLKSVLLARPLLLGTEAVATVRSYPSGHVAAATAVGAAIVVVAPPGWRVRSAIAAMTLTGVVGVAVLFAGWHRPSDAIGGVAIAIGWFAAVAAVLARKQPITSGNRSRGLGLPPRVWLASACLLVAGAIVFGLVEVARLSAQLNTPRHLAAFFSGTLVFVATDVLAYAALTTSLPPERATPPNHSGQSTGGSEESNQTTH